MEDETAKQSGAFGQESVGVGTFVCGQVAVRPIGHFEHRIRRHVPDLLAPSETLVDLSELHLLSVSRVPQEIVSHLRQCVRTARSGLHERNRRHAIFGTEDFIQHQRKSVDIVAADLDEQTAGVMEEGPSEDGVTADVVEVGVDPILVRVAEGADDADIVRYRLPRVPWNAIVHRRLEVAVELDAVRRVVIDHLDPAGQPVAVGERRHDPAGVAADEAVLPVAAVLVPLVGGVLRQVVVGRAEQFPGFPAVGGRRGQRAHEGGGMDLLVDVERVRLDLQGVGVVAAIPRETRFSGAVVADRGRVAAGRAIRVRHVGSGFLRRQVQPVGGGVRVGLRRRLPRGLLLGHQGDAAPWRPPRDAWARWIACSRSRPTSSGRVKMQ